MVKLRSRLIRSPNLPGAEFSSTETTTVIEGGGGGGGGRDQLPNPRDRASLPVAAAATTAVVVADQRRRPIQSCVSENSEGAVSAPGKRKPDNRGLTASIRRAKTAMFRMGPTTTSAAAASASFSPPFSPGSNSDHIIMDAGRSCGEICNGGCDEIMHSQGGEEEMTTGYNTTLTNFTAMPSTSGLHPCMDAAIPPATCTATRKNILEWLNDDAPSELLPKILSFCGSRKLNALSRVNKRWHDVMEDESVWRTLCEDTHKWSDGDDVPSSWAQYYKQNPCVPIDYDSIDAAFESISSGPQCEATENRVAQRFREQHKSARILLHPGPYFLRRPLVFNVIGSALITIQTIDGVKDPEHGMTWQKNYHGSSIISSNIMTMDTSSKPASSASLELRRPYSPTLRQLFGCGRRSSSSAADLDRSSSSSYSSGSERDHDDRDGDQSEHRAVFHRSCFQGRPTALLCLESSRENEPVIRVRQGTVNVRGLKLVHYCEGTDIWNGNAAIQVQRAFGRNGRPLRVEHPSVNPTANLSDCDIMSLSGRGLVVIDGAMSSIHNCNVHTCAATGIYVGGSGSEVRVSQTDVIDNGTGNTRTMHSIERRRGVARGHSGVYVENGLATMSDCNISGNTLTGISATSTDEARLHIENSDVRANRSDQMELPSPSSGRSINRNNTIASVGLGRPRSRHLKESSALDSPRGAREPSTPQSPLE